MANKKRAFNSLSTGLVYDQRMLAHNTGPLHPEQPARIKSCYDFLDEQKILPHLQLITPYEATYEQISLAHDPSYVEEVRRVAEGGGGCLDADTVVSAASYDAASLAAGGVLAAVDSLFKPEVKNCFCLVRPPGHHATFARGMGFCLFDNLAVGAKYAREVYQVSRILIVDWDAHHGNGIQDIFYDDPSVLYISLHQYPYYPGTGSFDEVGEGEGKGFTINFPFPAGTGIDSYLDAFEGVIAPVASEFEPDLIMVAAGFDGHFHDPLTSLNLTVEGFGRLSGEIVNLANKFSQGRALFSLEGGYDLKSLSYSVAQVVSVLAGLDKAMSDPYGSPVSKGDSFYLGVSGREVVGKVKRNIKDYWKL